LLSIATITPGKHKCRRQKKKGKKQKCQYSFFSHKLIPTLKCIFILIQNRSYLIIGDFFLKVNRIKSSLQRITAAVYAL